MIEATQKKLREARFFLNHLNSENRRGVRVDPEAFDYYVSAFISAARSVCYVLKKEEETKDPTKKDLWYPRWKTTLSSEDREFEKWMVGLRHIELKEGSGERRIELEFISVDQLSDEELGGEVTWTAPLGVPPPTMGRPIRYLKHEGRESEATAACARYYELLASLVDSYIKAHS